MRRMNDFGKLVILFWFIYFVFKADKIKTHKQT